MTDLSTARVGPPILADLAPIRARWRTSLFQGCAYAVDPRDRRGYLFQFQADRGEDVGPADVEDLRVHRFAIIHAEGGPRLDYLDTMVVDRGGHVQSGHVRISKAGNPYLWAGLEDYDAHGKQTGKSVYRLRYVPTPLNAAPSSRKSKTVERIFTGPGSCDVVGGPDWTIGLRRGGAESDRIEWHREKYLYGTRDRYRGQSRPEPHEAVGIKHGTLEAYQTSLLQGTWEHPRQAFRIDGLDRCRLRMNRPGDGTRTVELMPQIVKQLDKVAVDAIQSVEPEGAVTIGGVLHIAVQVNPPAHRFLAYLPVSW